MAYVTVKGGEQAIDNAHAWLAEERRGDTTVPDVSLAQITDNATFSHYFISCTVPGTSSGLVSKVLTYRSIED